MSRWPYDAAANSKVTVSSRGSAVLAEAAQPISLLMRHHLQVNRPHVSANPSATAGFLRNQRSWWPKTVRIELCQRTFKRAIRSWVHAFCGVSIRSRLFRAARESFKSSFPIAQRWRSIYGRNSVPCCASESKFGLTGLAQPNMLDAPI